MACRWWSSCMIWSPMKFITLVHRAMCVFPLMFPNTLAMSLVWVHSESLRRFEKWAWTTNVAFTKLLPRKCSVWFKRCRKQKKRRSIPALPMAVPRSTPTGWRLITASLTICMPPMVFSLTTSHLAGVKPLSRVKSPGRQHGSRWGFRINCI